MNCLLKGIFFCCLLCAIMWSFVAEGSVRALMIKMWLVAQLHLLSACFFFFFSKIQIYCNHSNYPPDRITKHEHKQHDHIWEFFLITSLSFAAQYFEFCFLLEMLNKISVSNWWKMQNSFKNLRCTKIIGEMFWLESSLTFVSDNNNREALFQMTDGDDWMTLRRGPSFSCCTTCALVLGFLQPGAAPS